MAKFVISKNKVLEQYRVLEGLADVISYSSKTNQDVTKILERETNCFFSVHLTNELVHIKDKSRVIFLSQGWDKKQIEELLSEGIKNFIVDNETDLDVLESIIESSSKKITIFLRVKLKERSLRTERYFVFGMNSYIVTKRIKSLNEKFENKISLGIHFHRKTQNMSEWNLQYELENILDKETLKIINFVNIGGGIPSEYANTNMKVIDSIFKKINTLKDWLKELNIKLMIEPGRFIAAPSGKLITKIINVYDNNIIVDASIYNSDMDALIVPVKLKIEGELEKGEGYVVKGVTPCSMDLFRYRVYLNNPQVGDELVFINAGAYNFTTDFCDLNKLKTVIVDNFN
ncbi:decarboxylase [Candidatus Woesearchaeota archaeon]|nr:decarboxylase [Candidatus Woesearchaeota archaeon]